MPRPTPPPERNPRRSSTPVTGTPRHPDIDPRWLLKAFVITILVALVCGYLSLCWLFYQGQWQVVLHPVTTVSSDPPTPESEFVRFAPGQTAIPQLTGWWIPAAAGAPYARNTILLLRSGDGSLAGDSALLTALHAIGINVFAFDYRGYGQSAPIHPSERNMAQDAESAWRYLHAFREIADRDIVPYGIGVGASLATHLAVVHSTSTAIILESPHSDLLDAVRQDHRARLLPVRLIFNQNFALIPTLSILHTSKLLLSVGPAPEAFQTASDPKITVAFSPNQDPIYNQPVFAQAVKRFLDQSIPPPPPPRLTFTPPAIAAPPQ